MNVKRIGIFVAVGLAVVLYFLNRKDVELIKQDNFTAIPIGNSGYQLNSVIHLNNPNLLSSTIKTISEKFYLEGRLVEILNLEINQGIPGMKETAFPINVRFSKADLTKIFPYDTLGTQMKAGVNVMGEIAFQNMVSSGKITVNQKDTLTIIGL